MSRSERKGVPHQRDTIDISNPNIYTRVFHEVLLDTIPVAIFFKDIDGRYLGCNQLFCDILGVSKDQIIGKTVFDLWPKELAEVYHQEDIELFSNPEPQHYDFQIKTLQVKPLDVTYRKGVFRNKHGAVTGLIGAFLGVTEAKDSARKLDDTVEKLSAGKDQVF